MSCQQASRFITTATTTVATATAKSTATKRIVTTTAQTPPAAKTSTATAKITTKTTPTASKVDVVDVENIGVAAKTNTIEDPYVFTETITATPPILFNAQKSRARLSEAQHSRNNKKNNNKQRVANKKSSIVAATTAAAAAAHNAQLNGTAVAATTTAASAKPAAEVAITKALASLGAAAASTTTTTNFNNVTQSQRQPASQQLQLQSPLQLQSQALPKRATNVCVVRPQQQQQQQLKQQAKLITKHAAPHPPPPPPLYTHTPSLWQTPLILDTTQKQQQQQQQQQQTNIVVATALVSSPTSPASLPSPTASSAPPTAAVTAMVSPIVSPATMSPPKGGSLPPSKFHHTTLAQHFAKVECLKKKKSLPLACQNSNNNTIAESLHKTKTTQVPRGKYSLTHPPPLTVFNTTTTTPAAAAAATTAMNKHSADAALDDNNDLNEIPVNVIFRKPPELLAGQIPPSSVDANLALKLGAVAPITPPTPLQLPLAANAVCPQLPVATTTTTTNAPALITQPAVIGAAAPIASIQNEQMSSKVANSAACIAAVPKRKTTPAGSTSARKGNKQIVKNSAQEASPSPPQQQQQHQTKVAVSSSPAPPPSQSEVPARRRKATAPASKRNALLFTETEPLEQDVPYCLQKHWLPADASRQLGLDQPASVTNNRDREERIAMRKGLLRHQALQLLSTRTLQELPLRAARQRLQSVQGLLLKYRDTASLQQGIGVGNRCLVAACKQPTLSMAAHCERHIVHNTTQQLFQPCLAWRVDGTACQAPVFDVLHTLALCPAHSHLRSGLELQSKKQLQQQQVKPAPTPAVTGPIPAVASTVIATAVAGKRKRKTNPNANPVGRPQKRVKKPEAITPTRNTTTTLPARPPMSAVMQRKSSTTSLESIASNSQSSAMSHSALPPYTPTAPMLAMPQLSIIPPALAPISDQLQLQLLQPKIEPEQQLDTSVNLLANASFKADEISQIVAQLAAASSELHHNNNSLHYNNNNSITYSSNNNSNSGSSSISCGFPSFNAAFGNAMSGQQQQIGGQLSCNNTTLDSTESLLSQHMFGICENSSAYASSEDTGLGGLSESELIGANDAGDIALNGAHLLEEHDLVNVFDTLPDDAFNELFQSVQQADCEAMDRALEIADKNLKCLQQTIGSTDHDSAFLSDLLDVGDDLLVNAVTSVMNSPNTSGIDAAALFVDSSGGGNSSSNGALGSSPAASVADIRGLVQT